MISSENLDVSVIMPAFQASRTIESALLSIAAQTQRPREVIVIDDGSSDGTLDIVRAARAGMRDIDLQLYTQPHLGPGAARNRGLAAARGRYVAFLDADDLWLPEKLQRSVNALESNDCGMVAHNIVEVSAAGERVVDCRQRWLANPMDPLRTLFVRGYVSSSTVVVRRELILAAGGFDPSLGSGQDYDLWLAILAESCRFLIFGDALLRYHLSEGGITSRVDQRLTCNLTIMRNHIGNLRRTPGPVVTPVVLRTLAIHLEAARGHWARGRYGRATTSILRAPLVLLSCLAALGAPPYRRPNFVEGVAVTGSTLL